MKYNVGEGHRTYSVIGRILMYWRHRQQGRKMPSGLETSRRLPLTAISAAPVPKLASFSEQLASRIKSAGLEDLLHNAHRLSSDKRLQLEAAQRITRNGQRRANRAMASIAVGRQTSHPLATNRAIIESPILYRKVCLETSRQNPFSLTEAESETRLAHGLFCRSGAPVASTY